MSEVDICDVCDKRMEPGDGNIWFCGFVDLLNYKRMDICNSCWKKFKEFVKGE